MFKLVGDIKVDTPELQCINYSGLCSALDKQDIKHWLFADADKYIFIVKGTIEVAYSLIPTLEQILSSKSSRDLNHNVVVQSHDKCMLLWTYTKGFNTQLLVVVSQDIDESAPYEDARAVIDDLVQNNAIGDGGDLDKLKTLLTFIVFNGTTLSSSAQKIVNSLVNPLENYKHGIVLHAAQAKSVCARVANQYDKEFWDWAFANAPKALLSEAYDILYSNLYEHFINTAQSV